MLEEIFVVNRLVLFGITVAIAVIMLIAIRREGARLFIRRIAGLEAIDGQWAGPQKWAVNAPE